MLDNKNVDLCSYPYGTTQRITQNHNLWYFGTVSNRPRDFAICFLYFVKIEGDKIRRPKVNDYTTFYHVKTACFIRSVCELRMLCSFYEKFLNRRVAIFPDFLFQPKVGRLRCDVQDGVGWFTPPGLIQSAWFFNDGWRPNKGGGAMLLNPEGLKFQATPLFENDYTS